MTACHPMAFEDCTAHTDEPVWHPPSPSLSDSGKQMDPRDSVGAPNQVVTPRRDSSKHEDYAALMKEANSLRVKGQTERAQRVAQVAFNILFSR